MLDNISRTKSARQCFIMLGILIFIFAGTIHCEKSETPPVQEETVKVGDVTHMPLVEQQECVTCKKTIVGNTACRVNLDSGREMITCCCYCAANIARRVGKQEYFKAVVACYATGEKIRFKDAYFVVGSEEVPCCKPSVLPFLSKEAAEKFAGAKGGTVAKYPEMLPLMDAAEKIMK
ncbi:MAG: nitrous oxide reductase accessory protein NosL [Candidatus Latescibacterota bacterium]